MEDFNSIKSKIEKCRICKERFEFEPQPLFWGNQNSKIVQISQAPSKVVNQTMKPFTDMSGKTLKYEWYKISDEEFYDKNNFYIGAMAHCYPGKDKRGNDRQPPKCCYDKWIKEELKYINNEIYIIIGARAANTFFPDKSYEELIFNNNELNGKLAVVMPHPSPLNRRWIKKHPQFLEKRIKEIREIIYEVIKKVN